MSVQRYVSSELTHFVGRSLRNRELRYRLLRRILRSGVLKAGPKAGLRGAHVLLKDPDLSLSSNDACRGSVVCFCDIPLGDLDVHMRKYSPFGLAFPKDFLAEQGAFAGFVCAGAWAAVLARVRSWAGSQRVAFDVFWRHWNRLPTLAADLKAEPVHGRAPADLERVIEFLETNVLSHLKFFDHGLHDEHPENYYLEREWGVSRDVAFDLEDVQRIIIPPEFSRRFRKDFPEYDGEIVFAEV